MKTPKGVRDPHSDELRKAKRLEPMRKSGKDRHALYSTLHDEEDEEYTYTRRESAHDYLDDDDEQ